MKTSRGKVPVIVVGLGLMAIACNLTGPGGIGGISEEMIQGTVDAELTAVVLSQPAPLQLAPSLEATGAATETATATPSITPTPTSSDPYASVSQATNCRQGPGVVYDWVYALQPNVQAKIVALSTVANYVVIEIPGQAPSTCWLWMQYGTITGSTEGLPQLTPPPTPTPSGPLPEFSLTHQSAPLCGSDVRWFVKITNTGSVPLESQDVSAINLDSSESSGGQSNVFGTSASCAAIAVQSLGPGDVGYVHADFTPPVNGETARMTVKACAGNGLAPPCSTEQIERTFPQASDVNSKQGFEPIEPSEVLALLAELEISRWRYAGPDSNGSHIGPMAQDFNRLFQVGDGEPVIYSVDSYGVALSAAQALLEQNKQQAAQLAELEAQNAALQARLDALEARQAANGSSGWILAVMGLIAVGWVLLKRTE